MVKRQQIIDKAREAIGVRWRHQGRTMLGFDCAGLVIWVGEQLKVLDYKFESYRMKEHHPDMLTHFIKAGFERISPSKARLGDVLVFKDRHYPAHIGFKSCRDGQETFLNANAKLKKVVETTGFYTLHPIIAAFRYPKVAD